MKEAGLCNRSNGAATRAHRPTRVAGERVFIIAQAVKRDAAGRLSVVMTPDLADLRAEAPDLWFVAEDEVPDALEATRRLTFAWLCRNFGIEMEMRDKGRGALSGAAAGLAVLAEKGDWSLRSQYLMDRHAGAGRSSATEPNRFRTGPLARQKRTR